MAEAEAGHMKVLHLPMAPGVAKRCEWDGGILGYGSAKGNWGRTGLGTKKR